MIIHSSKNPIILNEGLFYRFKKKEKNKYNPKQSNKSSNNSINKKEEHFVANNQKHKYPSEEELVKAKETIEAVFPIISKEMKKINNLITDMPNSVDECLKRYKENYNDYYKGLIIYFGGDYPYSEYFGTDEEWTDNEIDKYNQSLYDAMYRINNNKICNKYGTFFIDQGADIDQYWCYFDDSEYDPKEIEKLLHGDYSSLSE